VNARDLRTLVTDLTRAEELLKQIPARFLRVAESGIHDLHDLARMRAAGADAALVGEALMKSADPAARLRGWRTFLAPPRIKVCGITTAADARAAVAAGAEALGVILAPSPRRVDAGRAREIVNAAGGIPVAGVFVDAARAEVESAIAATGIAAVQLCGRERAEDFARLPVPLWRRIAVREPGAAEELRRWLPQASLFVLDHPDSAGGSGRAVDPVLARALAALAPCLLAGGLDAANAGTAAAEVRPYGLDASSRLERAPGLKDHHRVQDFVHAARHALI
jgi:phosphoribosylanthranilate isomerase